MQQLDGVVESSSHSLNGHQSFFNGQSFISSKCVAQIFLYSFWPFFAICDPLCSHFLSFSPFIPG